MFDMNFEFDNNTLSLNHIDNDYLDFLQFCVQHNFNILIKDVHSSRFIDCLLACQKNGYNNITCVETSNIAPDGLKLKNNVYILCRKFKVTVENLMSYTFETCMADSDNNQHLCIKGGF